MAKIDPLDDVGSLANTTSARAVINNNSQKIEDAFENTLSRDGSTPNQMEADIDLNDHFLMNVADPVSDADAVNLRSVRPLVEQFAAQIVETAVFGTLVVDTYAAATVSQTLFVLSNAPGAVENVEFFVNGLAKRPGIDFTVSGTDLKNLTLTVPLSGGELCFARYTRALPSGVTTSGAVTYTPAATGTTISIQVFLDALSEVPVELFGAVGNGTTDDVLAFRAAALTGKRISLRAGKTYVLSGGVSFSTGTGFVCRDGIATIRLKTGVGGFTNIAFGGTRTALDRCVFSMVSTDNNEIDGIKFTTDGVQQCCLYPIRTSSGFATDGLRIGRVKFSGFHMGVLVGLNTVGAGSYSIGEIDARDCGTSQGIAYWGAGIGQFTVLEVDNDMVASVPSVHGDVERVSGINILHTGTAVTDYGQQTDLINIAGISGTDRKGPTIKSWYADGVGEALDLFCTGAVIKGGRARNVHNFVAKFVHGAQLNEVDIDVIESFGLGAVTFAGSSALTGHTQHNVVRVGTVRGAGDAGSGPTTANIPVVLVQENGGAIGTSLPRNNLCTVEHLVAGANLDYVARDNCSVDNGNDNRVIVTKMTGYPAISYANTAHLPNTRARYKSANAARLSIGVSQTLSTGVNATVQYQTIQSDLDALANTGTYTIRPKYPGWYKMRAQIRVSGNNNTDFATMRIQRAGSSIAQVARGYATSGVEVVHDVETTVYVSENEAGTSAADFTAQVTHSGAATVTALNTATMSYFEVSPLG